jgi:hypothetical protein
MLAALEADTATIESGDTVGGVDADIEIIDQAGNKVYSDVDERKDLIDANRQYPRRYRDA